MAKSITPFKTLALFTLVFSLTIGSASCGLFDWIYSFRCHFTACCDDKQIITNFSGLKTDLATILHGQHLARKLVHSHVKAHFTSSDPPKALALAFHGPTGVGKNFVSKMIADNIYKEGMYSKYVHFISATRDFQHESLLDQYKNKLALWIEEGVKDCDRSMFIFDEADKLPHGLLDVIKPYLDYYPQIGGIDYRKAFFLFLSNSGTSAIMKTYMEYWRQGQPRDDLKFKMIEEPLMTTIFNDKQDGGFQHGRIIVNSLMTAFIPFLPLEKQHVRRCIEDEMANKDLKPIINCHFRPEDIEDEVLEELTWIPEEEKLFSATGCKRVSEKIDLVIEDKKDTCKGHHDESKEEL